MGRGGQRDGSGRKPKTPTEKRMTVTARVLPATAEKIKRMKEEDGFRLGVAIDKMIKGLR